MKKQELKAEQKRVKALVIANAKSEKIDYSNNIKKVEVYMKQIDKQFGITGNSIVVAISKVNSPNMGLPDVYSYLYIVDEALNVRYAAMIDGVNVPINYEKI